MTDNEVSELNFIVEHEETIEKFSLVRYFRGLIIILF